MSDALCMAVLICSPFLVPASFMFVGDVLKARRYIMCWLGRHPDEIIRGKRQPQRWRCAECWRTIPERPTKETP